MVPAARLELARPFDRQILSLLCLPFHQAGTGTTLPVSCSQIKRDRQQSCQFHFKMSAQLGKQSTRKLAKDFEISISSAENHVMITES